jgi:hypothetical protein
LMLTVLVLVVFAAFVFVGVMPLSIAHLAD